MKFPEPKQLVKNLQADVLELCQPSGRMVGSLGHIDAEQLLLRRLSEVGCKPYANDSYELPYIAEGFNESGRHVRRGQTALRLGACDDQAGEYFGGSDFADLPSDEPRAGAAAVVFIFLLAAWHGGSRPLSLLLFRWRLNRAHCH